MSKNDGPCRIEACSNVGKRILGLCRRHYSYFYSTGIEEIPKHTPQALQVSPEVAHWLAAVIDCEGWIGATRAKRKHGYCYTFGVGVGNTNIKLINRLVEITGMGRTSKVVLESNAKDKHMWEVFVYEDVRNFLATIRPYLILKQRQADIVLNLPPKNARAVEERKAAWDECHRLNKKGKM